MSDKEIRKQVITVQAGELYRKVLQGGWELGLLVGWGFIHESEQVLGESDLSPERGKENSWKQGILAIQ